MPIFHMLEESVATDYSDNVSIMAHVDVDDREPKMSVFYSISDRQNGTKLLELELKFEVTNPIWITSFDPTFAAGAYGVCVANKLSHATYDKAKECYDEHTANNPDATNMERIRAVGQCLADQGQHFKDEFKKALKECLTFGIFGGGSSGDDS